MITQEGYNRIIELDSIRAIRLFLKLVQLANDNKITITQTQLAKDLKLKNKANINVTISELIEKGFIKKRTEKNKITYFINPKFVVTQKGYEVLQKEYQIFNVKFDFDFDILLSDFVEGEN